MTKRVTFAPGTKSHDGPHPVAQLLEDITFAYFETRCIRSVHDMRIQFYKHWKLPREQLLSWTKHLENLIVDVVERSKNADARFQLLARGGGRGMCLTTVHIPHFKQMASYMTTVLEGWRSHSRKSAEQYGPLA